MADSAQVRSTEAIEQFRIALAKFEERANSALESIEGKLRRASDWLDHECPIYWKLQTKLAEDGVHQAKVDLERCLLTPTAGERPSCREEKAALVVAQQRLEYCRQKRTRAQHWKRQMTHELFEHRARMAQLQRMLELDLPAARAALQQIVRTIDDYQIERPPLAAEPREAASEKLE